MDPSTARISNTTSRDALIDETIKVFQPHYEDELTREDARGIAHNLTGVFELLLVWKRRREASGSANTGDPSGVTNSEPGG